jgi:hypothetical protein
MYHCHILEHEDRGMMRPIVVTPRELMAKDASGSSFWVYNLPMQLPQGGDRSVCDP